MKGNQLPIITTTVDNRLIILVGLLGRPKTTLVASVNCDVCIFNNVEHFKGYTENGSRQKVVGWNAALTSL